MRIGLLHKEISNVLIRCVPQHQPDACRWGHGKVVRLETVYLVHIRLGAMKTAVDFVLGQRRFLFIVRVLLVPATESAATMLHLAASWP